MGPPHSLQTSHGLRQAQRLQRAQHRRRDRVSATTLADIQRLLAPNAPSGEALLDAEPGKRRIITQTQCQRDRLPEQDVSELAFLVHGLVCPGVVVERVRSGRERRRRTVRGQPSHEVCSLVGRNHQRRSARAQHDGLIANQLGDEGDLAPGVALKTVGGMTPKLNA